MKPNLFSKFFAEFLGTMVLVLMGCGSAVIAGANGTTGVGLLGIAFAFGLAVVAMAYAIGHISGCHINPAITIGMVVVGRMKATEAIPYIIAQVLGAIAGAAVLLVIASGKPDYSIVINGLGQNGYGEASPGHYSLLAGFIAETMFTFIFLLVIFGATSTKNIYGGFAGLSIGLSLVLIHIVGIPVTGVSVNPARSIGPALLTGGVAISQLWLFILAPVLGSVLSAVTWRYLLEAE
ncbi:aquaporin Z [Mucilaginibacter sp. FT3.2]|uniref:aquaporin Z n=1 Tax=Mucilaginibacter sp. FT3.2 TaxID=2723090 RepID=UPI001611CD66|nr:aquaporin Z [Mucilaginibacter sp. FT3.2]MBB6232395.1 aquaporin Z [Mucilaginibacter sp. FT3.2]